MLTSGTVLQGRYRVIRTLGMGGMGAVYLVLDIRLANKPVAVKELIPAPNASPAEQAQSQQQFQMEAATLAALNHPNLPRVSDFFSEAGRNYLVMDYIDGETLQDLLDHTQGLLPESEVLNWATQVCNVLAYLHNRHPPVIFRDLKPANIMLDRSGTIKLIDFGIARLFKPGKTTDTLRMGTTGYAPPEQFAGKGQTDARSDIYSLGATLHHLLTRRDPTQCVPFTFHTAPPRSVNPAISPQTDATILRAVEYDRANRFQSVVEMKQALLGKLQPSPVPPAAISPPVSQPGLVQRLLPFLLLGAIATFVVGAAMLSSALARPTRPTPTTYALHPTSTPIHIIMVVTATPEPAARTAILSTPTPIRIIVVVTATPEPATYTAIPPTPVPPPTNTPIPPPTAAPVGMSLSEAEALNKQAEELYQYSSTRSRSIGIWQQIVNARPDYVKGLYHLAGSYFDLGQIDAAISYSQTALTYDPYCINALYVVGLAYEKEGWYSQACDLWRNITGLNYENSPNHTNRAHIQQLKNAAQTKLSQCSR